MAASNYLVTNEDVLLAAGITAEEIAAVKTGNMQTAVNALESIWGKLVAYVETQRVMKANGWNPLRFLERNYTAYNRGSYHGYFQEILVQMRDIGANKLYGGEKHVPKQIKNPYTTADWGKAPLQYTYGINASIQRTLHYDRNDLLMYLQREALVDLVSVLVAEIEQEGINSRYIFENNVLNCERFQYTDYANITPFTNASDVNGFMHKVLTDQNYPETNTQYKRVKYNTTRGDSGYILILDKEFAFEFAQKYQFKQYLKPYVFRDDESDRYYWQDDRENESRILEVDKLTPTTLAANAVLDPLNMTAATLPANSKLVGRIIDLNAPKFGIGKKDVVSYPLDARTMYYNSIEDYCINMCDAYVNVPILISNDFSYDRIISVANVTPAPAVTKASK